MENTMRRIASAIMMRKKRKTKARMLMRQSRGLIKQMLLPKVLKRYRKSKSQLMRIKYKNIGHIVHSLFYSAFNQPGSDKARSFNRSNCPLFLLIKIKTSKLCQILQVSLIIISSALFTCQTAPVKSVVILIEELFCSCETASKAELKFVHGEPQPSFFFFRNTFNYWKINQITCLS